MSGGPLQLQLDLGLATPPAPSGEAAVGEAWLGPWGLLDVLETSLGLRGPAQPAAVRAAALVPNVQARAGFWSESATIDPLGTARRLLYWRDQLWLEGWRGQPLAPRLAQLADVTAHVLPGLPDRLLTILRTLERRGGADIEELALLAAAEELPRLWRRLIEALEAQGTRLRWRRLEPAAATPAIEAARRGEAAPASAHGLWLLRPAGPLQAAEEVAAWLAAQPSREGTVIIGPDPVLDRALCRHGQPTTGALGQREDNLLLQILPLVLDVGWSPAAPEQMQQLLSLHPSPVPPGIGRRLLNALREFPAVGSPKWDEALAEGLGSIEQPSRRLAVGQRLGKLLSGWVKRQDRYPAIEVRRRIEALMRWLQGRKEYEADDARGPWQGAVNQCVALRRLVDLSGLRDFSSAQLHRFVDDATEEVAPQPMFPAQAGLAAVYAPGALAGPVRRVVWWRFDAEAAAPVARLPLTRDERDALAAAGLGLPDPTRRAVAAARRWRRPIEQVTQVALLVCPRRNERGEALHPHPLWDELVARRSEEERRALVVTSAEGLPTPQGIPPRRRRRALRAVPAARRSWSVEAGRIPPPERLSPTALGDVIGCSFKWFVERVGRIRAGFTQPLPGEAQLLGTVAHELIAGLLRGPALLAPEEAFDRARAAFDQHGPRLAAPLFIPGSEVTRAATRQATGLAARELFRILGEDQLEVVAVEQPVETEALGTILTGRPDLVVASPLAVIDFKWGGESYRRQSFESGTNYQLAAYAVLLAEEARELPRVANFILRSQRLLTDERDLSRSAHYVEGPGVAATWQALERAYLAARSRLEEGLIEAPGNPDDLGAVPEEDQVVDGRLELKPPCWFCDLGRLCGLALEAETS